MATGAKWMCLFGARLFRLGHVASQQQHPALILPRELELLLRVVPVLWPVNTQSF